MPQIAFLFSLLERRRAFFAARGTALVASAPPGCLTCEESKVVRSGLIVAGCHVDTVQQAMGHAFVHNGVEHLRALLADGRGQVANGQLRAGSRRSAKQPLSPVSERRLPYGASLNARKFSTMRDGSGTPF